MRERLVTTVLVVCFLGSASGVIAQKAAKTPVGAKERRATAAVRKPVDMKAVNTLKSRLEEEIACEAARRGLLERDDVQESLKKARRQVLTQALKKDFGRSLPPLTEKELNDAYQRLRNHWMIPESYLIDAVEISKLDPKTQAVARGLVTGKPVSDKAIDFLMKHALVNQKRGQWVTRQNLAPEIWQALAKMKMNEVRVIKTQGGEFLIRKGLHRQQGALPLEQVRNQLAVIIKQQKMEKAWNDYLMELQRKLLQQK